MEAIFLTLANDFFLGFLLLLACNGKPKLGWVTKVFKLDWANIAFDTKQIRNSKTNPKPFKF